MVVVTCAVVVVLVIVDVVVVVVIVLILAVGIVIIVGLVVTSVACDSYNKASATSNCTNYNYYQDISFDIIFSLSRNYCSWITYHSS